MLKRLALAVSVVFAASALVLFSASQSAMAGSASDSFNLSANVVTVCRMAAQDLHFGDYSGAELTGTANWQAQCSTSQTALSFTYDLGLHFVDGEQHMKRVDGEDLLQYDWTVKLVGAFTNAAGIVNGFISFKVPAGQIVPAGAYQDTMVVTANF